MSRKLSLSMSLGLAGVLAVALAAFARQDEPAPKPGAQEPAKNQGLLAGMGQILVKGLKATDGCLGVETAETSSGKGVIFAWFQDRASVVGWYESAMHQGMTFAVTGGPTDHVPLADVPDDTGPILVIASITPAEKAQIKGIRMPISQMAIELYTPLPGGAVIGGRFAPEAVKVPGLHDYTPADGK